ncbi:VOC family protein [Rhodoligotrophos defluvii]|uniref:VOC family protein n=1 Tax=Rhodoligotrophos defluvii TaxID=2561934 RepID=UPI0010C9CD5E|nr:VOC family protein [Rhodoligotrophos defluvii]
MKGIDHLVLCVNDLDEAAARYKAMGFTCTPRAIHPFGTMNQLVQFDGSFLEVLAVREPTEVPEHGARHFSFAAFNRDFLERGEGFSMLVLDSDDARADQQRYLQAGISRFEPFDFQRKAKLPDGEEVTVGFSLAFAAHEAMGRAGFFVCQQRAPQYFWKREYQVHANGALGLGDALMMGEHPKAYAEFFAAFTGVEPQVLADEEIGFRLSRGGVRMLSPAAWEKHFPAALAPDLAEGPCFAGFVVQVNDLGRAAEALDDGRIAYLRDGGRLIVAPDEAFNTTILFEERH